MNDEFKISQLTKELVAMNLKERQNPCAVAAGVVRQTIDVALKARPHEARRVVSDACYGGLQGLLLAEQDLACGVLLILSAVQGRAGELEPSAAEMRSYCIEGFARIAKFVSREDLAAICRALERRHQAGQAFTDALSAQEAAPASRA